MKNLIVSFNKFFDGKSWFLQSIVLLGIRLYMAYVFFQSGLTKIASWDATLYLFETDYAAVPFIPHDIAAYMATAAELSMPVFLVLGLLTPFAGLALAGMAFVIGNYIYDWQQEQVYWLLLFLSLVVFGGGKFSIDEIVLKKLRKK